jgi:hypothetical protein
VKLKIILGTAAVILLILLVSAVWLAPDEMITRKAVAVAPAWHISPDGPTGTACATIDAVSTLGLPDEYHPKLTVYCKKEGEFAVLVDTDLRVKSFIPSDDSYSVMLRLD